MKGGESVIRRVAHLGPAGTFSEEAAVLYIRDSEARLVSLSSIAAVFSAVETGMADEGIVPIENSLEGSVAATLDLLIHESSLLIRHEILLTISHCLLTRPGTPVESIRVLYAHPQALGQCRRFVDRCLPKADVVAALSNAAAVEEMMADDRPSAAIGPERAAVIYGSEVLARGIQDESANVTRFVVLATEDHPPTGCDRTSICFTVPEDVPGALCGVLQEFAAERINLSKIESRPTKEALGRYFFLADIEGHRLDPLVAQVLERVRPKADQLKIFGSYPRWRG